MALIDFSTIKEIIGDSTAGKNKEVLFKEVLLLVLARATRADANVESIEVTHVQNALKEITGEQFSEADILTAASSEVFETQSLERTLANATRKLSEEERITILECLASLIRADTFIRYPELEFFDHVATALRASPSEIAGLSVTSN
ncbi:MAG: TerB family tellurite resistance protein [Pseudomonadales bacterium]|nr:TerB family tellurite resistance protein [Pseudomonadales bacterium]